MKIKKLSLLLASVAIISSCTGGGNSNDNPPPPPNPTNIEFKNTNLNEFLTQNNLNNYDVSNSPNVVIGDYLYFTASSNLKRIVLQYNSTNNSWSVLNNGVQFSDSTMLLNIQNNLVAYDGSSIYKLNSSNNTWVKANGTNDNYNIISYNIDNIFLTNPNLSFVAKNNTSYLFYNYNVNTNTVEVTNTTTFNEYPSHSIYQNGASFLISGGNESGNFTYNLNGTIVNTNLKEKDSSVSDLNNNLFILQTKTTLLDNPDAFKYDYYVCGISGCNILQGASFNILNNTSVYNYVEFSLSNGIVSFKNPSPNMLSYSITDTTTGVISSYKCNFDVSGNVSNCNKATPDVTPFVYSDNTSLQPGLTWFNKINNTIFGMSLGFYFNLTYSNIQLNLGYNQYTLSSDGASWKQTNPSFENYTNNYSISLVPICGYLLDNNSPILMQTVESMSSTSLNYYISNNNSWDKLAVPTGSTPSINIIQDELSSSNNTLTSNVKGLWTTTYTDGKPTGYYFAKYQVNCSKTFN